MNSKIDKALQQKFRDDSRGAYHHPASTTTLLSGGGGNAKL